jgi:hypothetical protein
LRALAEAVVVELIDTEVVAGAVAGAVAGGVAVEETVVIDVVGSYEEARQGCSVYE